MPKRGERSQKREMGSVWKGKNYCEKKLPNYALVFYLEVDT